MSDTTDIAGDIRELRQRTTVLTWAVGIIAALVIAMLGNTITELHDLIAINHKMGVLLESFSGRGRSARAICRWR